MWPQGNFSGFCGHHQKLPVKHLWGQFISPDRKMQATRNLVKRHNRIQKLVICSISAKTADRISGRKHIRSCNKQQNRNWIWRTHLFSQAFFICKDWFYYNLTILLLILYPSVNSFKENNIRWVSLSVIFKDSVSLVQYQLTAMSPSQVCSCLLPICAPETVNP